MTFVALSIADWPTGAAATDLAAALLAVAPRVALAQGDGIAWLDARGLDPEPLISRAIAALDQIGSRDVTAGVAAIPVIAEIAARTIAREQGTRCVVIPRGGERDFLAVLPIHVVTSDTQLIQDRKSVV